MKTHIISSDLTTTLKAKADGDTWIIQNGVSIITGDVGIEAGTHGEGQHVIVNGLVSAPGQGISWGQMSGTGAGVLTIGVNGEVDCSGGYAVVSRSNGQVIVNNGEIHGLNGIGVAGGHTEITNHGVIETDNSGVELDVRGETLINDGRIIGGDIGIFSSAGTANGNPLIKIDNTGVIGGDKHGVQMQGDTDVFLDNEGKINGNIETGAGDDTFDNRGGTFKDYAALGAGNDTYIVTNNTDLLVENVSGGTETVKSTASFILADNFENLVLLGGDNHNATGNTIDNRLIGNSGKNIIDGDGGDDVLIGGGGADTFVFGYHYQHDTIKDFENGVDHIDVSTWAGISNFQDIKSHLTVSGNDLLISTGSDEILLNDMHKADLDKSDFVF